MGTWMGFSTPIKGGDTFGFIGPFSLLSYKWMASSLAEITLTDHPTLKPEIESNYLPGIVRLTGSYPNGIQLIQELIYVDSETALLRLRSSREIDIQLEGSFLEHQIKLTKLDKGVLIETQDETFSILTLEPTDFTLTKKSYSTAISSLHETYFAITQHRSNINFDKVTSLLERGAELFIENENRWNGYLEAVLRDDLSPEMDRIAAKSVVTLMSNWVAPQGDILHDGIIPSHAIWFFIGLWSWDSWKTAVGMLDFEPQLAQDQILALFDYQAPNGMIPDCVYPDSTLNNWRNTKPPLAAWAVEKVYQTTGDREFLSSIFPKLIKYYYWWYEHRDVDQNGICEYGSSDQTHEAAAWESGMDNAVRFDGAKIITGAAGDGSLNQESLDLNAYLIYEREILERLAQEIGIDFVGRGISREKFLERFYEPTDRFFYDRSVKTKEWIKIKGCEAYTPIWTQIATPQQVEEMLPILTDTLHFATYVPFPTLDASHPEFAYDKYWRGSIWLDQSYFAVSGLRKYGYTEAADRFTQELFEHLGGASEDAPIYENYDAHTGEGLRARHFSWSAAHLLMLYKEYGQ